jgi:hypothetical protein
MTTSQQMKDALANIKQAQAEDTILNTLRREMDRLLLHAASWKALPAEGTPERLEANLLIDAVARPANRQMQVLNEQINLRAAQISKVIYARIGARPRLATPVPAGYRTPDFIPVDLSDPVEAALAATELVDLEVGHAASLRLPVYGLPATEEAMAAFMATPAPRAWTAADHKVP